jgi:hypothetical protein
MRLSVLYENQDETMNDCEHTFLKYEARSISPGLVGYKLSDNPAAIGPKIMPKYVLAQEESSKVVDYTHTGNFGGAYLLKIQFPELGGRTTEDIGVVEWGNQCTYFAGNPTVSATSRHIKAGDEVLILTETVVLDVYKTNDESRYINSSGDILRII